MTTDSRAGGPRRRWRRAFRVLLIVALLAIYPVRACRRIRGRADRAEGLSASSNRRVRRRPLPPLALPDAGPLRWSQRGGTINDASCLNRTPVRGVVEVRQVEDVRNALAFARQHGLRVSIAGVRHSMGGHAFARNALVLDMRGFNRIALDEAGGSGPRRERGDVARHSEGHPPEVGGEVDAVH